MSDRVYCTIKFNVYPNVIMEDPLLDVPQVHQAASTIRPLRSFTVTNDPKVLTSSSDTVELQANIKNANECWDYVVSKYPQYFIGMEAKVYDAEEPSRVVYSQEVPFDIWENTPVYYKNDDAKIVAYASTSIPCWCSEQDRYDWVKDHIATQAFITKKIAPFTPTKDIVLTKVDAKAIEPSQNGYMRLLERDEYIEKHGYYRCSKEEYDEALENGFRKRTDEELYEQLKEAQAERKRNEIPEPVDFSPSEPNDFEKSLFGESEDGEMFDDI